MIASAPVGAHLIGRAAFRTRVAGRPAHPLRPGGGVVPPASAVKRRRRPERRKLPARAPADALAKRRDPADIPAMALPPGFVDDLRGRISIAQVIGRKVSWDPRRTNAAKGDYWSPCPFHQEKTASFHVEDAKGFFYCFGCHAEGRRDRLPARRARTSASWRRSRRWPREAGVPMPAADPAAAVRAERARGLAEAMEAAVQLLPAPARRRRAAEARAYLDRRGLAPRRATASRSATPPTGGPRSSST